MATETGGLTGLVALHDRGISEETIARFEIEPTSRGIRYPVRRNGVIEDWRHKAAEPRDGAKYWWEHAHDAKSCGAFVYAPPELPEHVDVLWVTEGEPDMWIASQEGLQAMTLLGGAGVVNDKAVALIAARAKKVRIVYDLDAAGRAGREKLAAALTARGVRCTLVDLPEWLDADGDLNDLFIAYRYARDLTPIAASGEPPIPPLEPLDGERLQRDQAYFTESAQWHSFAEILDALASVGQIWQDLRAEATPPASQSVGRLIFRLADLADLRSAAEDSVVGGGLLTRGGKLLIAGTAGAGKTTFVNYFAASMASGRPVLGRYRMDRAYRVLCISAELVVAELASHGQALLGPFENTSATENLVFWLETGLRLPRCYAELREVTHETRAEIVIVDPFMEFFEGDSSDKPEHVQKVFGALDQLQRDEGLAGTIVVHHMGVAGQRSAGSWKFDGWPSTILELEKVPGVPTDRMLVFKKIRAPGFGQPEKMQIRLSDAGYLPITHEEAQRTAGELVVVDALRSAGGQLRRKDLIDHVRSRGNVQLRSAAGYIGKAKQEGLIEALQDGREVIYRLPEPA